jgi:hypothetical protein
MAAMAGGKLKKCVCACECVAFCLTRGWPCGNGMGICKAHAPHVVCVRTRAHYLKGLLGRWRWHEILLPRLLSLSFFGRKRDRGIASRDPEHACLDGNW